MTVFMFPGQGSQFVGMGQELYQRYSYVRDIFTMADKTLSMPLSELIFEGPADLLQQTVNAQPALLTISVALGELLRRHGLQPAAVAGHSLGEYSALVAAGSLDFVDALRLVRHRGQYMQEAVPLGQGGMMAVLGLSRDQVERGCELASTAGIVEVANLNCPGQVVIAGHNEALQQAQVHLKELGARRCLLLQVSAPFHCSLMQPAGVKMGHLLAGVEIRDPQLPVVVNVDAHYAASGDQIRDALVRQVSSPVQWEQSIQRLIADGHDLFVEVGPGQVLSGLVKKINRNVCTVNFGDLTAPEKVIAGLKEIESNES